MMSTMPNYTQLYLSVPTMPNYNEQDWVDCEESLLKILVRVLFRPKIY